MTRAPTTDLPIAVQPEARAFVRGYEAGAPQVVWTRLVADLETPVSAALKLVSDRPMSFLLESVEGGSVRGRYSVIGFAPDIIWRAFGDKPEINRAPERSLEKFKPMKGGTLKALRVLLDESRIDLPASLPPMAAGVFGHMGYDTVRLVEKLPAEKPDPYGVPDSLLMRPTLMVIFDAVKDEMLVCTPVRPAKGVTADAALAAATERLSEVVTALEGPLPHGPASEPDATSATILPAGNTTPAQYMKMVRQAKEYILAGDIFQVVLSQRFSTPFALPSFALYRALRRTNPSPFLFHLDFGAYALIGSSPEILVRARDGEVTIRPIAGTRPRGKTPEEDKALAAELLSDEKELAEHLMLLDLGRNDVGRIAEIGSVKVTDKFFLEYYSHVMHIVSNVTGRLDAEHDAIDALMAGFPAGTVSGAPKVRAMQIIDELEKDKRGPYGGCVGYFSATGQMDTCIVLRTALLKDGVMHVQAGAGIVMDSSPDMEQAECRAKAEALFRAAEEAARFAKSGRRRG